MKQKSLLSIPLCVLIFFSFSTCTPKGNLTKVHYRVALQFSDYTMDRNPNPSLACKGEQGTNIRIISDFRRALCVFEITGIENTDTNPVDFTFDPANAYLKGDYPQDTIRLFDVTALWGNAIPSLRSFNKCSGMQYVPRSNDVAAGKSYVKDIHFENNCVFIIEMPQSLKPFQNGNMQTYGVLSLFYSNPHINAPSVIMIPDNPPVPAFVDHIFYPELQKALDN